MRRGPKDRVASRIGAIHVSGTPERSRGRPLRSGATLWYNPVMTPVADYKCLCGEGPLYDARRDCVFWSDIDAGRLFRIDRATLQHRQIYASEPVGGFTLQDDGSLILFRVKDIARLDPESGQVTKLRDFVEDDIPRFNDTSAGPPPARKIYAGTMGKTGESGGLFEISPDGVMRNLFRGTGCANGMGWTPDLRTMYWTCSTRNVIFAYDFDAATGAMGGEGVFHQARDRKTEGTCDGMAVDSLGNVYSARWGGYPPGRVAAEEDHRPGRQRHFALLRRPGPEGRVRHHRLPRRRHERCRGALPLPQRHPRPARVPQRPQGLKLTKDAPPLVSRASRPCRPEGPIGGTSRRCICPARFQVERQRQPFSCVPTPVNRTADTTSDRLSLSPGAESERSSVWAHALRSLVGVLLLAVVAFVSFKLCTENNTFPSSYHPDEGGKVRQVVSPGDLNFNHPLLLIEGTIRLRQILGGTLETENIVLGGRTFSAVMVVVAAVSLAGAAWRGGGLAALAVVGVTVSLCPSLVVAGHYMKEDASLLGGIGLVVLAGTMAATTRGRTARLAWYAGLGLACAVAASGKAVGAAMLVIPAMLVVFGPGPGWRCWSGRLGERFARAVLVGLALGAGVVTINHRGFNFATFPPIPRHDAVNGIGREIEHATTEHVGLRLAVPNTYAIRVTRSEAVPWLLGLAVAGVALVLIRTGVSLARRRRVDDGLVFPLLLGVTGVTFVALLSQNVIPFARYALPVVVMTHALAGVGVLLVGRTVAATFAWGLARWRTGAGADGGASEPVASPRTVRYARAERGVVVLLTVAVGAVMWAEARDVTRRFGDDSREKVRAFIGTLPPGTRVVADAYAGLGRFGRGSRDGARVWNQRFAPDALAGGNDTGGFDYVVICDTAFDRFLDPEVRGASEDQRWFAHRRDTYRALLAREPVWAYIPRRPLRAFTDPEIRVIKLE